MAKKTTAKKKAAPKKRGRKSNAEKAAEAAAAGGEVAAVENTKAVPVDNLAGALAFVALAQNGNESYQTHCRIGHGWVTATDGILSAGYPCEIDLTCCPNTRKLITALDNVPSEASVKLAANMRLHVKGKKFSAYVPTLEEALIMRAQPDANIAPITEAVVTALQCAGKLLREGGTRVIESAALLQAHTAVATNGVILVEAFHGTDLPPGLVVPLAFIKALGKIDSETVGFGYTPGQSITFWFEDGSFLKTQMYNEQFPQYASLFDVEAKPTEIPKDFFESVATVGSFANDGLIFFDGKFIRSHADGIEDGAALAFKGLPAGRYYTADMLDRIAELASSIDLNVTNKHGSPVAVFYGDDPCQLRGVLMGRKPPQAETAPQPFQPPQQSPTGFQPPSAPPQGWGSAQQQQPAPFQPAPGFTAMPDFGNGNGSAV